VRCPSAAEPLGAIPAGPSGPAPTSHSGAPRRGVVTSRSSGPHRGQLPFPAPAEPLGAIPAGPSGPAPTSHSGAPHRGSVPRPSVPELPGAFGT
jgi:hypothetical protein